MRLLLLVITILILPVTSAISDLSIYAEAKYENRSEAPILVEWFHGEGDEAQVEDLARMDTNQDITLLHLSLIHI